MMPDDDDDDDDDDPMILNIRAKYHTSERTIVPWTVIFMSIIVATGIYALLLKFLQKNSPHNVQTKGGGGAKAF